MENDSNVQTEGLKVIYGRSTSSLLATKDITALSYHNKKPKFYDEIKVQLPPNLTPSHHLLVTFYHIQCQSKKGKDERLATTLGYSVIPLMEGGRYFAIIFLFLT
jgi:hypothetical protein